MFKKIISGGQTGVDRIALEVAKLLGFSTGGTAAMGYLTEKGADLSLKTEFGLDEARFPGYNYRTEKNVKDADFTVVFGSVTSPGSHLTIQLCIKWGKPYKENPTVDELVTIIKDKKVRVLNVAGNRASRLSEELRGSITQKLVDALQKLQFIMLHDHKY